jgi:hypothetical protein
MADIQRGNVSVRSRTQAAIGDYSQRSHGESRQSSLRGFAVVDRSTTGGLYVDLAEETLEVRSRERDYVLEPRACRRESLLQEIAAVRAPPSA